jgi:hypothetical protein
MAATKRKWRKSFLSLPDSLIEEICQFLPFSETGTSFQIINKQLRHFLKSKQNWNSELWNRRQYQVSKLLFSFPNLRIRQYKISFYTDYLKLLKNLKVQNVKYVYLDFFEDEEYLRNCLASLESFQNLVHLDLCAYTFTPGTAFLATWCIQFFVALSQIPKLQKITLRTGSRCLLYLFLEEFSFLPLKRLHWDFGVRFDKSILELISKLPGLCSLCLVGLSTGHKVETPTGTTTNQMKEKPSKACLEKLSVFMLDVAFDQFYNLFYLGNLQYLTLSCFLTESDLDRIRIEIPLLKSFALNNLPSVESICLDGLQFLETLELNFKLDVAKQSKIHFLFQFGNIPLKFLVLPKMALGYQDTKTKIRVNKALVKLTKTYQLKSLSTTCKKSNVFKDDIDLHLLSSSNLKNLQSIKMHLTETSCNEQIEFILELQGLQYLTLSGYINEKIEVLLKKSRSLKCLHIPGKCIDKEKLNLWRDQNPKIGICVD